MSASSQRPLELILARNLLSSLSTPAFLANRPGDIIFYNEAAGSLLGRRFEETGKMPAEDWVNAFGPLDERGNPIPVEEQPLTVALADEPPCSRPSHDALAEWRRARRRGERAPDHRHRRIPGSDGVLLGRRRGEDLKVRGGARGSIPAPGPETTRYGGNTSCLQLTLSDGSMLVLDGGTGSEASGCPCRRPRSRCTSC